MDDVDWVDGMDEIGPVEQILNGCSHLKHLGTILLGSYRIGPFLSNPFQG